jgi:hypothetical protein
MTALLILRDKAKRLEVKLKQKVVQNSLFWQSTTAMVFSDKMLLLFLVAIVKPKTHSLSTNYFG